MLRNDISGKIVIIQETQTLGRNINDTTLDDKKSDCQNTERKTFNINK